jgi:hypothetical protein
MARAEGIVDLDLLLCLSSEAGRTVAKQPAWAARLEAGMPDLTVWTIDDTGVLMIPADEQRFRWSRHSSDESLTLMPTRHRGDPRDDEAWQSVLDHDLYEGESPLAGALDLTGGVLIGFDAYEPGAVRVTIDVAPGEYLVVPTYNHRKRLRYLSIVERACFQRWQDA